MRRRLVWPCVWRVPRASIPMSPRVLNAPIAIAVSSKALLNRHYAILAMLATPCLVRGRANVMLVTLAPSLIRLPFYIVMTARLGSTKVPMHSPLVMTVLSALTVTYLAVSRAFLVWLVRTQTSRAPSRATVAFRDRTKVTRVKVYVTYVRWARLPIC